MYRINRIASHTRTTAVAAIALFGIAFSSSAAAIEYRKDLPMIITYKNDYGNWNGCGPVQCTVSNWATQQRVVDLITHDSHGHFRHLGSVGRCQVYQSSGELDPYDKQPEEIADLMSDKC